MDFSDVMAREGAKKLTENGAVAFNTAGSGALLDMFSQAGALRPRSEEEISKKFAAAYREDKLLATKLLFYTGDIRQGGLGERRTFRICLKWLAKNDPQVVLKNLKLIPFYNRFDSWFVLEGTPCEPAMWEQVAITLREDVAAAKARKVGEVVPISLLAKWMPSENTSSVKTRKMATRARMSLGLTPRAYRRMLSTLRKYINVVETEMSAGNWNKIDYEKVPSYAMHNYGSAFAKHDYDRFNAFLNRVDRGEAKINATTLYPYDLVHSYLKGNGAWYRSVREDSVVEAQWKALPNYVTESVNAVVMADISGSMMGRPLETSIGLAIYFAQHNKGNYHNKYMTFSSDPSFVTLREGDSLASCVNIASSRGMGYSTDLEAAFQKILVDARRNGVSKEEMPKALVVISDMEINPYFTGRRDLDFVQEQKRRFNLYGYDLPKLVLWNVEARHDTYLTQCDDVILLSGQSASTFKNLCQNLDGVTAYEMMLRILNSQAYAKVTV